MIAPIIEGVLDPVLAAIPDDRTVEARYPKVIWATHSRLRRCQRKCFLIAEYYRKNPEAEAHIVARNRAFDARTRGYNEGGTALLRYAGERVNGDVPPLIWEGIEETAPHPPMRKLVTGKRGLPSERDD